VGWVSSFFWQQEDNVKEREVRWAGQRVQIQHEVLCLPSLTGHLLRDLVSWSGQQSFDILQL